MTDEAFSDERTRRSVLKHTGVGALALSAPTAATAASSGTKTRMLEAAITYDVLSEPSESNVEFRNYTICPGPVYHVEDGAVRIPTSGNLETIGQLFEDAGQLVNFGGLRLHEDNRQLGKVRTESIVKSTTGSLRPYELWILANGRTHMIPGFRIETDSDRSIVTTEQDQFEVAVGETERQTLPSERVEISAIEFSNGTFDNPAIPDRELSQKYEHVSRRVEAQPELVVSDRGLVELE